MQEHHGPECRLDWHILNNKVFDLFVGGHIMPVDRAWMVECRAVLLQALESNPDAPVLEVPLPPLTLVVHHTHEQVWARVAKIDGDLAYLGALDMKNAQEGFTG